jgi:methylmalonyl-CoA/ethylmalonyl-CoA epimerase
MEIKRLAIVSIAVRDLEQSVANWERILGLRPGVRFHDEHEKLDIARFYLGGTALELIQPTADNAVSRFLERRGEGVFVLVFEVDDVRRAMAELREKGVPLVEDSPVEGMEGSYFNIHPRAMNGVLVQLWSGQLLAPAK